MPFAWQKTLDALQRETLALAFAARDPHVPWTARAVIALVLAYAASPIDLIPDFVPVLGQIDDLIIVPLGVALAVRLIPPQVMGDARQRAEVALTESPRLSRWGALLVVAIWVVVLAIVAALAWRLWRQ